MEATIYPSSRIPASYVIVADIDDYNDGMEYVVIPAERVTSVEILKRKYDLYMIKVNHEFGTWVDNNIPYLARYYSNVKFFPSVPLGRQQSIALVNWLEYRYQYEFDNNSLMTGSNLLQCINEFEVNEDAKRIHFIKVKRNMRRVNALAVAVWHTLSKGRYGLRGGVLPDDIKRMILDFLI